MVSGPLKVIIITAIISKESFNCYMCTLLDIHDSSKVSYPCRQAIRSTFFWAHRPVFMSRFGGHPLRATCPCFPMAFSSERVLNNGRHGILLTGKILRQVWHPRTHWRTTHKHGQNVFWREMPSKRFLRQVEF